MTPDQERHAADLMQQAQRGHQAAVAELLAMLTPTIRRYVRGRLGAVPWGDDVVQETLLTVYLARRSYDVRRPFAPWFYAVARSRLVDAVRQQRRIAAREVADQAAPEPATGERSGRDADAVDVEAIRRALAALPVRQRDVIEGLKYRDESVREIAGRLGLTESAVKVTAHRGYRALRRLLGGAGREDRGPHRQTRK